MTYFTKLDVCFCTKYILILYLANSQDKHVVFVHGQSLLHLVLPLKWFAFYQNIKHASIDIQVFVQVLITRFDFQNCFLIQGQTHIASSCTSRKCSYMHLKLHFALNIFTIIMEQNFVAMCTKGKDELLLQSTIVFFFSKIKLLSHQLGRIITRRLYKEAYTQNGESPSDQDQENETTYIVFQTDYLK